MIHFYTCLLSLTNDFNAGQSANLKSKNSWFSNNRKSVFIIENPMHKLLLNYQSYHAVCSSSFQVKSMHSPVFLSCYVLSARKITQFGTTLTLIDEGIASLVSINCFFCYSVFAPKFLILSPTDNTQWPNSKGLWAYFYWIIPLIHVRHLLIQWCLAII